MRIPRRNRLAPPPNTLDVGEHPDDEDEYQSPEEFLDRHHPENDGYMKAITHVQGKIMYLTTMLRTKQVNILKSVFSGENYTQTGKRHGACPATVSRLVKSNYGQQLLNMLQYHRQLLEGPNEAMRRNMLWRIAQKSEKFEKRVSIKAISELNKMHFQQAQIDNPNVGGQQQVTQTTIINIDQTLMPRGKLD